MREWNTSVLQKKNTYITPILVLDVTGLFKCIVYCFMETQKGGKQLYYQTHRGNP